MTFNGVDLSTLLGDEYNDINKGYFIVNGVYGRGGDTLDNKRISVTGMAGSYPTYSDVMSRELNVHVALKAPTTVEMHRKVELLKEALNTKGVPAPIEFADEPGRTYYGRLASIEATIESSRIYKAVILIECNDPYKYGAEETILIPDIESVNIKGTSAVEPIFELTAHERSTFALVSMGDEEYNMAGRPSDASEVQVDTRTEIVNERGEGLSGWTSSGTEIDSTTAKVQGELGTDGTGIVPLSYGSKPAGSVWYGPALMKEVPPTQDFEIEMRLRAQTTNPKQVYRIEFYLFDENMKSLGKMGILDSSESRERYALEGRHGPFVGRGINYPISSANYLYYDRHFHGVLRMRRIGQRFEFYVARLSAGETEIGKHFQQLNRVFHDVQNEFQGKLKYVQIHIGMHTKGTKISLPRINNFKVTELKSVKVDETPYVIYPGDVVTFDHVSKDILINGEVRNDLKDFGGTFFNLEPGHNRLVVTPSELFSTYVRYRSKYL